MEPCRYPNFAPPHQHSIPYQNSMYLSLLSIASISTGRLTGSVYGCHSFAFFGCKLVECLSTHQCFGASQHTQSIKLGCSICIYEHLKNVALGTMLSLTPCSTFMHAKWYPKAPAFAVTGVKLWYTLPSCCKQLLVLSSLGNCAI